MQRQADELWRIIDTDVLVLGTGAAGCGAALAAAEKGAKVLMVDRGKIESSGCLGGGNDHFLAVLNSGPETDSTEAAIEFYNTPVSGYTPAMIKKWIEVMPRMISFLEEIGVGFIKNPDGSYFRTSGFGQPGSWWINIKNGQLIKRRLARKIRSLGVDVIDHVMVTRIITCRGRAGGALGYNVIDGTFYIFRAKSVVMAVGNSANRAVTNSTGNPFNTWHSPFNTGSQFVLAYECGAKLVNLDLKQQATLVPKGFGCAGMNGINSAGAHELNAFGERFMGKYHPLMENGPRREQIQGTYQEQRDGRGPPFHMEMRHISPEELYHLQYVLMPGDKATFLDYCEQRGVDFARYPMEVELSEIELSGMIQTDENFESTVKGLFNGCVFYSFSGSICSGYLAARSAVDSASAIPEPGEVDPLEVQREYESIFSPLKRKDGIRYDRFETAIRQVMGYYMGYVRNGRGMEIALDRLKFIESHKDRIQASNYHELMRANESMHLLITCRLSTLATLQRKESGRAIYHRSDYPEPDKAYARVLSLWKEGGRDEFSWV
ncbi:MAG: FAD-binding protein [Desulfobacteraceae bacterium]|nr:FAD-binding protein [Desulfobacteraceae bacterium]